MKRLAVMALMVAPAPALSGAECMPEALVMDLIGDFGEQPVMTGDFELNGQTARIALFVNPDTGTWTYVGQPMTGVLCVIDHGSHAVIHEVNEGEGL